MKRLILIAALLASACTDSSKAERLLREQGYRDIALTGYDFWMCSEDDDFSTGFEATSPAGVKVKGAVCSSWFSKGATIRFK